MPKDALIGLIYEAVNDPLLWDAFLIRFAEAIHADTAGLLTQDRIGHWAKVLAAVGLQPASRKSYEDYFVSRNPWLPKRNILTRSVETGEQLLSNRELVKTEFYSGLLKPNGWLHGCSAITNVDDSAFSCIYALRAPHNRAFSSDEIELCWHLAPHIKAAAQIQKRIANLEATLAQLRAGEMDAQTLSNFALTPAETRLAIALFQGQSVEAYAKDTATSVSTARWHVKQIYAKTGVKRQTELIHKLLKASRASS